jgi:hypothetical protein
MGSRNKEFKERWFEIRAIRDPRQDGQIDYFKQEGDTTSKGSICFGPLDEVGFETGEDGKDGHFTIATAGRTYHLLASSAGQAKAWAQAIQEQQQVLLSARGMSGAKAMTEPKLLAETVMPALFSGTLSKMGARNKEFKERWFELREDRIDYFKGEGVGKLRGSIPIGLHAEVSGRFYCHACEPLH